jgi:hypothetical protein
MVCTYTSGHVDADEQACAAVTMGTTLSKPECEAVRTSADILTPACTYTPPNYGCIYTSDATPTCDLDPNTDGTAECPTGCEEVADADVIPAVAETCDYPSLGSNPGDPMSNTVFTPFRVSVNTGVNNYECWNGYIPGTAEIPSTTCTPGCYFVPAVDYVAPVPEICNGTAANPSMTCDVDPTTDGTDVCPDGCMHFSALPGIDAVAETCTPTSTVSAHSPSGAYVSTAQSTEWTLASLYVADFAELHIEWYCAQACFGEESAAEASGEWLPGAVTPEEQCWASTETVCSSEIDAANTPRGNEGTPPQYITGRRRMAVAGAGAR